MLDINYLDIKDKNGIQDFLLYIDTYPNKVQFARIQILDWDEQPLKTEKGEDIYIEGRVTGGNLNLNGNSNVRRNGSLSLCLSEVDDFYKVEQIENILSLNKKIKLEIGYELEYSENTEETKKIKNFLSYNYIWFPLGVFIIKNPSLNRSLSGLTLSLTLSDKMSLLNGENGGSLPAAVVFSETTTQNNDKNYNKIKDIIFTLVSQYGGIRPEKIIINDIEDRIVQVMKWSGATDLYRYKQNNTYFIDTQAPEGVVVEQTYKQGENIGFILTDFIWPGQALSSNIGETVTSVLDKIKTLGDYEYFFDINGNFIWQKKEVYVYGESSSITQNQFYIDDAAVARIAIPTLNENQIDIAYDFINSPLIISYSNTPQYKNINNDYIVWGKRKTSSGAELPIRYHIIFDEPIEYSEEIDTTVNCYKYLIAEPDIYGFQVVFKGVSENFPNKPEKNKYYIYNNKEYIYDFDLKKFKNVNIITIDFNDKDDWRTLLYFRGKREEAGGKTQIYFDNPLYKDLEIEWPKLYDIENKSWRIMYPDGDTIDYYCHIINAGNNLNCSSVGRHLVKVLNNTNINCVYSPDIGDNLILKLGEDISDEIKVYETKYKIVRVSDEIYQQLYIGGSQNSAFEQARTLITQGTGYANTVSISTIPIYHLEPNTLIKIDDEESSIHGTYVINTISLPLAYNGTMTISASKALIQQ